MFALFFCTLVLTLIAAAWALFAVGGGADDASRRRSLARLHVVFAVLGALVAGGCLFCAFCGAWVLTQPDVTDPEVNRMNATGGTGMVAGGMVGFLLSGLWVAANVVAARRTGYPTHVPNRWSRQR